METRELPSRFADIPECNAILCIGRGEKSRVDGIVHHCMHRLRVVSQDVGFWRNKKFVNYFKIFLSMHLNVF